MKINFDCNYKTPEVISFDLLNQFHQQDLTNILITIRLDGTLERGKVSDLNFKDIFQQLYGQGAYFIMKNTAQLQSKEFEEIKLTQSNPENIEENLIQEHLQQVKVFDQETELHLTKTLLKTLNTTKKEGETVTDFQQRVEEETNKILNF